ncbi:hypothetical protein [Glycomyces terrestris]|uniref:PE domain-containing protein n=1 Tax=Glycomyces terrestris TaxID=2493553 RepID=A0A426V4F8_9ACTN|nr:hypothetical protein [Glycomyces terrestris]RRS01757.1 hypothetical protein EIW28_03085 [Glycomyces terrestris]
MAGGMQIDPDLLEDIGTKLGALGGEFATIAQDFVATMEGLSEAYGSDETGGLILAIHQDILTAFQECLQDASADIEAGAQTLADIGATTRELDDAVASAFSDILGELGA